MLINLEACWKVKAVKLAFGWTIVSILYLPALHVSFMLQMDPGRDKSTEIFVIFSLNLHFSLGIITILNILE